MNFVLKYISDMKFPDFEDLFYENKGNQKKLR